MRRQSDELSRKIGIGLKFLTGVQSSDMANSDNQMRDIDAVIRTVQAQMPEIVVTRLKPTWPADDANLWWFSLPEVRQDIQVEGANCPFLVETEEHSSLDALHASTIEEAVRLIWEYLSAAREKISSPHD